MDEWLVLRLTETQQQIYKQLLQVRYRNNETDGFIVDFDDLWKELGYTRKDNAKQKLVDQLVLDKDYILLPGIQEQTPQRGGHNAETIRLTTKGAKLFSMRARTRLGDEVAEFFVDVLDAFSDYHLITLHFQTDAATRSLQTAQTKLLQDAEESRQREEAAQKEASEAKAALEREKAKTESLKRQLKDRHEVGESVYLIENAADDERKLYKIGKSQDLSRREKNFETALPDGTNTLHCRHCTNSTLVEKIMHHILAKYRYKPIREWFQGPAKYFAKLLDAVVDFVDGLVEAGENIQEFDFNKRLEKLIRKARNYDADDVADLSEASSSDSVLVVTGGTNNIVVNVNHLVPAKRFIRECLVRARPPEEHQVEYSFISEKFREWGEANSVAVGRDELRVLKSSEYLGPPKNTSLHKDKWQSVLGYSVPVDKNKSCPDVYGWKG